MNGFCLGLVALALALQGCQLATTKTAETQTRAFEDLVDKTQQEIEITEKTVVLDARSPFDYGLNRVENSLQLGWEDLAETAESGDVGHDLRKLALRLSLVGLKPTTPVVIVGSGASGRGAEGRLAWTLLYLGFQDVQVANMEALRKFWTQAPSPPAKNVGLWTAEPREDLKISQPEFTALARDPKARLAGHVWILDVRSEAKYFNRVKGVPPVPDVGALHIEWKEFFTAKGRPDFKIRRKLQGLNIQPSDRIILVSQHGVRSGAAAYALLALGYTNVQNYVSGWRTYQ